MLQNSSYQSMLLPIAFCSCMQMRGAHLQRHGRPNPQAGQHNGRDNPAAAARWLPLVPLRCRPGGRFWDMQGARRRGAGRLPRQDTREHHEWSGPVVSADRCGRPGNLQRREARIRKCPVRVLPRSQQLGPAARRPASASRVL